MTIPGPQSPTALTPAALRRRLKRHVLKATHSFFAVCQPGFEPWLESEVRHLPGAESVRAEEGGVACDGPLDLVYHANLSLCTAVRVLVRVGSFRATSFPELHNRAKRVAWEHWVGMAEGVRYEVSAKRSRLMHERRTVSAVHEALAGNMAKLGRSVVVDAESLVCVHVRVSQDRCTLSMDTSGELLHKRGYRTTPIRSPIRETTAAALLMSCGFAAHGALVDPVCGSGTFPIEAARMLRGIPPGADRRCAFESLPWYSRPKWERLRSAALAAVRPASGCVLAGSDVAAEAVEAARANAEAAGVGEDVSFAVADARTLTRDSRLGPDGLLIGNLPYGKRTARTGVSRELYPALGARLREQFRGWEFAFVIPRGAEALLGLPISTRLRFVNGGIPVVCVGGRIP